MGPQRKGGLLTGAALAVAACLMGTALSADQGVLAARAPQALRLVVVGDSLSTGYGTSPSWAWPRLLSAEDPGRVDVVNASENGGGYLAVGDDGGTFGSQAAASVTADTGMVVFFGSENDMGEDPSDVADAAVAALESARSAAPAAKIVVVGPTAFTDEPEGLWSLALQRKGGAYALVARMPLDPSLN